MWSDNDTAVDLLNVQHIVTAVLSVVRNPRLSPVTAGVYGDWGSGKSSVIRMVKAKLDEDPETLCIYFNGWRFEGYEDAKVALASTILEELQHAINDNRSPLSRLGHDARARLGSLLRSVDRLKIGKAFTAAGINAGIAAGTVALATAASGGVVTGQAILAAAAASLLDQTGKIDGEAVADVLKEQEKAEREEHRETRRTVREFQSEFEKLVVELGLTRLVVVVDDLDRCLPPNVIDTFEAIRLFLSVPNTAFVIAADEGVMRHAVASRFPSYEDAAPAGGRRKVDVGGRYLEKFIHVPVRVPPLSPGDLHGYLNLLFAEKHATAPDHFPAFCEKVRQATAYDQVAFRAEDAEALLGEPPSQALLEDLALAARIAPVLALSAEGNPRQTKRFLNALLLRLEMAEARKVKLDRAVAAKLLLLEYFQPQVFAELASSAAANGGKPPEITLLETEARGETVREPEGDDGAGAAHEETGLPPYALGLLLKPQAKAWFASDPRVGGVDLRPYVYFTADRFLGASGSDERLSPAAQTALSDLRSGSEAMQRRGAAAAVTLKQAELSVVIATLAQDALAAEDLRDDVSPLTALWRLADDRPELAADVLRAVATLPAAKLPKGAAVRVASFDSAPAQAVARKLLARWAEQTENKGLATSARDRGNRLEKALSDARAR